MWLFMVWSLHREIISEVCKMEEVPDFSGAASFILDLTLGFENRASTEEGTPSNKFENKDIWERQVSHKHGEQ